MALVTIVGYPCSGKSTIATKLKAYFEERLAEEGYNGPRLEVILVSDESSHVSRSVYDGTHSSLICRDGSCQTPKSRNQAVQTSFPTLLEISLRAIL